MNAHYEMKKGEILQTSPFLKLLLESLHFDQAISDPVGCGMNPVKSVDPPRSGVE